MMDVIYVIERVIMWFVLLNIVCVNNVVIEFVLLDGICLTLLLCYSIDYFVISCYFDYSADNNYVQESSSYWRRSLTCQKNKIKDFRITFDCCYSTGTTLTSIFLDENCLNSSQCSFMTQGRY